MTRAVLALTVCLLCAGAAQGEDTRMGPLISREDFFAGLDYSVPGLSAVRSAVGKGDYAAATAALLDYMRARRSVKYFVNWWDRPAQTTPGYDTSKADDICRHIFHGGIADWYPPYDLGPRIDWAASPYNDREWFWGINRHQHWSILGRAYWATGDEKYATEFVAQLVDWVRTRPVVTDGKHNSSASWRTIEAGIRMSGSWPESYQLFLTSPSFTPEANLLYLMSTVDHARHLAANPTGGNWLTMEMNGLLHVGVLFPEFKQSAEWRKLALDRLSRELGVQVYPDGMQFELTTGYHRVAMSNFREPMKLLELNDVEAPAGYMDALEKMYQALMYIGKPCGYVPALNDSDARIETVPESGKWSNVRGDLEEGAARFGRKDMLYVLTHGAEGEPPADVSHVFSYAGLYVMRQDWSPDALYLVFDAGPFGAGHQHEDKLSFEAFAYGETLLYDPGRFSYADMLGGYMRSTAAHNTCLVDGQGQARGRQPASDRKWIVSEPVVNPWISTPVFDYVEGVYDDGYGPDRYRGVTHRRSVVFVKRGYWLIVDRFEGQGSHKLDTLFHFAPGKVRVDDAALTCASANLGRPNVLIRPSETKGVSVSVLEGSTSPYQGWISTEYNSKVAAPVADYAWSGELPVEFAYLLYPSRPSDEVGVTSVRRIEVTVDGNPDPRASAYEVNAGGKTDVVLIAYGVDGAKRFGGAQTEDQIAVITVER